MTKWEYLTALIPVHAAKQIPDNLGSDGWELVQIVPGMNPENLVGYFKRPVARMATPEEKLADGSVPRWPSRWRRTSPRCGPAATSSRPASCR